MAWSDRWIAKAAHVILAKYSSNPPPFPACTPKEYKEAYDFMDRVLACVNACAEVPIETLRDLHVKDIIKWSSVHDGLPKCENQKSEDIGWIVWRPKATSKKLMTTYVHPDWWKEDNGTSAEITHWMPLPEVPNAR